MTLWVGNKGGTKKDAEWLGKKGFPRYIKKKKKYKNHLDLVINWNWNFEINIQVKCIISALLMKNNLVGKEI